MFLGKRKISARKSYFSESFHLEANLKLKLLHWISSAHLWGSELLDSFPYFLSSCCGWGGKHVNIWSKPQGQQVYKKVNSRWGKSCRFSPPAMQWFMSPDLPLTTMGPPSFPLLHSCIVSGCFCLFAVVCSRFDAQIEIIFSLTVKAKPTTLTNTVYLSPFLTKQLLMCAEMDSKTNTQMFVFLGNRQMISLFRVWFTWSVWMRRKRRLLSRLASWPHSCSASFPSLRLRGFFSEVGKKRCFITTTEMHSVNNNGPRRHKHQSICNVMLDYKS